uniref:Uncharacterized protein n=1 Tax=Ananas comosus var. bracteatus TaxID=296719 RepID=A0A6V7NPC3_ANACO|nr:unnamed protein product [Ananas comosus var. bracteatus]
MQHQSSLSPKKKKKKKREEEKSSLSLSTFLYKPGIRVVVPLPNELLAAAASRPGYALGWVKRNVAAYYQAIQIAAVAVDNEMFASPRSSLIALLVQAMTNVHAALARLDLDGAMKVSSPIALTALRASYPPSVGAFSNDLAERVMRPMLDLLRHTGSYLMRLEEPKFDADSAVDEHLDVVPRGLHPIYVDKSRRRYLVSSDLIDHPLFRVLIERSDGGEGMSSAVIIVREVVLLEHLLRMLRNVGVHPSRVDVRRLRRFLHLRPCHYIDYIIAATSNSLLRFQSNRSCATHHAHQLFDEMPKTHFSTANLTCI